MSGETFVKYGVITIRHCNTHSITQVPVLDASGTDQMYWKFTVKVSGIVHGKSTWCQWAIPTSPANPGGTSGTQALIGLRVGLPPRQSFEMRVGRPDGGNDQSGEEILKAVPFSTTVSKPGSLTGFDVKNGPLCTEFVVTKIAGGDIYHIDATFEIHKVECSYNGQATENTRGILSNRWSVIDSIDQNRRLVRSYTGTLVLAGADFYNPNMFRGILVPPLQPRMRRDNMSFVVSEDGLSLRYTFSDSQVAQAPPAPCSQWELSVSQSTSITRITKREVSGVLVCPDDKGNAADLALLAWYIIGAKIHGKKWDDPNIQKSSALLETVSFTEHVGEKTALSFSASFQISQTIPANQNDVGAADFYQKFIGFTGMPLRSDLLPASAANYNPYQNDGGRFSAATGSGVERPYIQGAVPLASMFLAYLQSCCSDAHDLVPSESASFPENTNEPTRYGPVSEVPVYTSPTLPEEDTAYFTPGAKTYAYTAWKMSSTISDRTMRAAMPIAKRQDTSTSSGGSPVEPPDDTAFVRLSGTQARRIVRIHAERLGQWPEMPDLENLPGFSQTDAGAGHAGPRQKLLKTRRLYALPEVAATGQKYYTVGIEATYGLSRAPLASEFLPVGNHIWNTEGNVETNINATKAPSWPTS